MSISAVVPVWNGRELLARLLDTVDAQTLRADETLVVDNGSTDGAPELARERGARVITMGRNAGFAAAVNRGIEEARSEWVAVVNSDVELAPDYFERCCGGGIEAAGCPAARAGSPPGPQVWFATGRILDARRNGVIDGTFDLTCRGGTTWRAGSGRPDGPMFGESRRIVSAPWTAALFRAEVFRKVGLLETSFESYLEDVDFGLRCAEKGIFGQYLPSAVAWHQGSATLGRWHPDTVRRIARNQLFLAARHLPAEFWWPVAVAQGLWGGVALRHGRGAAWVRGVIEGLRGFRGARRGFRPIGPGLIEQLRQSEGAIRALQQAAPGMDLYWRLYFLFTGGEAK